MKKFKSFYEDITFKVEVEGLPALFMAGNSPGQVKNHLRKLIKQPSMIKSVERQTKHAVKKMYRDKAQGKEVAEGALDERTPVRPTVQDKKLKNLRVPNPNYKGLLKRKEKEKRDIYREIKSADIKKEDNVNEKLTGKDSKGHFRATEKGAGMTQKGVDAVNRKTGGNLKTAVTGKVKPGSKAAGRRKSYCARSAGQLKQFPKAAADPNSRLRQARRRWKC